MLDLRRGMRKAVKTSWLGTLDMAHRAGVLPGSLLRLPDFLGVGSPQSGTTWLYQNLTRHPDLFLTDRKELCFFDRHFDHGLARYAWNFHAAGDRKAGEITPSYSLLKPDRIRCIRELLPDLRVFLIIRHPVERAWSAARRLFSRRHGGDLGQAPREDVLGYLRREHAWLGEERGTTGYYVTGGRWGEYSVIIPNWEREFSDDRLFFGFFRDIRDRPQALLQGLFRFLGVTPDVAWSDFLLDQPVNANPPLACPPEYEEYLRSTYAAEIAWLEGRFGTSSF